jgi:hypothetical protein
LDSPTFLPLSREDAIVLYRLLRPREDDFCGSTAILYDRLRRFVYAASSIDEIEDLDRGLPSVVGDPASSKEPPRGSPQ